MNGMIRIAVLTALLAAWASAQSLWNPERPAQALFADTTARGVGDILTIEIDESQEVQNDERTTLEKETSLDALLSNFDVLPDFFNTLPQVRGSSSRSFEGTGRVDKDASFKTRISVVVIDVLPNGSMLVEGTRRIDIDGDRKVIRLTGLVRPYDVSKRNTVRSEQVANAAFAFEGTGPLTRSVTKGWFSRLLDVVWPF